MRSSWFPGLGAALFVGALVHLTGCNAAESLVSSSHGAVSNAATEMASKRTLLFQESALEVGERARNWRASSGVHVGRFVTKKRSGVAFRAHAGSRVRARTGALPGTFGRATKAKVRLSVRDASQEHPVTVRFDFLDAAGSARWSQTVTFEDARWKTVTLRLPTHTSPAAALFPPMRDVSSWGMTFASDTDVRVQDFELWRNGTPEAPSLGLAVLDVAIGEPPAMKASRGVTSSWLRGESPVRLDTAFDGLVSLHRQMADRFPGVPDLEEQSPLTASVHGGIQTLWKLAEVAMGEPPKMSKPRSRYPQPNRPALPVPWVGMVW